MPVKTKKFLPFSSPLDLLSFYDEDILEGRIKLYPWQKEISKEIALIPQSGVETEIDVVTNNGSGKTKMVLSPAAVYNTCQYDTSETVITSASGVQADKQTSRFVKDLAGKMNNYHKDDLWVIQDRKLVFKPTDGIIDIFATDDPLKAEGWHPRGFDTAFTKLVDEAKAVEDGIFEALDRCSGSQWYIRASSPRIGTNGYFYRKVVSGLTKLFKITAYQCPHLSESYINNIIATYGLHSPITRSIIFAEFTSVDQSVVMQYDKLLELIKTRILPCTKNQPKRVGCDMAAGGDENVITYFEGNIQRDLRPFREKDTVRTKELIVQFLTLWGIPKDSEYLFFDDGHVGHAIIDMLWRENWNIKRVINQSAAVRLPNMYANRGAELYSSFANFVNNFEIQLINDPILLSQLGNRYYSQSGIGSKIKLESKIEARAKGHPSPDRGDATVLSLSDIQSPHFMPGEKQSEAPQSKGAVTQQELIELMDNLRYANLFKEHTQPVQGNVINNLAALVGKELDENESTRDEVYSEWKAILNQLRN